MGLTTFRQPYTPVTFGTLAGAARDDLFDPVRCTPIHSWAVAQGARFEDVGQWKRAWYFPERGEDIHGAVNREVRVTREIAGLFDASTLGKIEVVGPDAAEFLNRLYTNAWTKLGVGRCRYGLMLNEPGFVMDDGVVGRLAADRFHVTTTTGGAPARAPPYGGLPPDRVPGPQGLAHLRHRAVGRHRRSGPPSPATSSRL